MMVDRKRAQFYLMAAIIIVVVLIGIATVTNYAITRQSAEEVKVYQLSQEIELESEHVVNFGIYKENIGVEAALEQFTAEYGEYISNQENNVYFVYGNKKGITIIGYVYKDVGSVGLNLGGDDISFEVTRAEVEGREFDFDDDNLDVVHSNLNKLFGCTLTGNVVSEKATFSDTPCSDLVDGGELIESDVIVEIGGIRYPFNLKRGENFFFVIQEDREQRCVKDSDCGLISVETVCVDGVNTQITTTPICDDGVCRYREEGEARGACS